MDQLSEIPLQHPPTPGSLSVMAQPCHHSGRRSSSPAMRMHISNPWLLQGFLQNSSEYSLLDCMSEFSASAIAPTVASVTANLLVRVYYMLATFLGDSLQYLILYPVSNLSY